ncbi:hypothetical protein EDC96DRAFT_418779, partial [Choanephora cucurbitarum]
SYSDRNHADALGKNTLTDGEEFFIESSNGSEKENQIKKASTNSRTKKSTFGMQVIKKTLMLIKVTLSKTGKWNVVEVGSSRTSTCWEPRGQWGSLFEMMATIY